MSRPLRIAVAQYEPHVGDLEHNRSRAVRWATSAADQGAQLIVLPELASSGYVFGDEAEAQRSAEDPDDGPTVRALREVCAQHSCFIVAGISERDGDCRHNSAVLIGATLSGVIGALLAIPVAAAIQIVVRDVWQQHHDGISEAPA